MDEIKDHLAGVMEKYLKTAPVDDKCPLMDTTLRPKWKCGKFDRGNESFCQSVSGFSKCPHYVKWFYWNLWRLIAKETAKLKLEQKKKEAKKKL